MGPHGNGDLFFIRYYSDSSVAFGFFSTGQVVLEGDRVTVVPGSEHEVKLLCGDLIPGNLGPAYADIRNRILVRLDGQVVLDRTAAPKDFPPEQVYAGVCAIMENYTAEDFSGEILSAVREDDLSQYVAGKVGHQ
jgi:hypothetical protein